MLYDLQDITVPRASGRTLKILTHLLESGKTRWMVEEKIKKDIGFTNFQQTPIETPPTFLPHFPALTDSAHALPALEQIEQQTRYLKTPSFRFWSTVDYATAYREKRLSPVVIAERVLNAIEDSDKLNPPMRSFLQTRQDDVLAQAQASAQRHAESRPLSLLDGVPVAIKDELDQVGYPTTVGTTFLGNPAATSDATVVKRLRQAGALLIGKTNMHEIGNGVTGMNPHYGHARNPYHPQCITGGSSSGSAASVAMGLCPLAIGADGGGSIRIPAGICGVVGLKATFGRISEYGATPLCWSVAHVGPIAATVSDAILAYALIAGPDPLDPQSQHQPLAHLNNLANENLEGISVGVFEPWFQHAQPDVVEACQHSLRNLEKRGAKLIPIEIPNLDLMRLAHGIIISSEMATAMSDVYPKNHTKFGFDIRINLAIARTLTSRDYIKAQQVRTLAMDTFNNILKQVDAIATPTTACTGTPIPPDAIEMGDSDLSLLTQIMRYAFPANLTGLPAISVPVGYDSHGMPIGLQFMSGAWMEHTLFRLARVVETGVTTNQPQIYYDLLRT